MVDKRANWKDPEILKTFLDACIEESTSGNRSGSSFKKRSWDLIGNLMKEKKGLDLTQKQLKNQLDYLKRKYNIWERIVNKTGNGYDPISNTVSWTSEEWDDYTKIYPDAKQIRYVGLQFADEMKSLFDGITTTGKDAWGPSMEEMPPTIPNSNITIDVDVEVEVDVDLEREISHSPSIEHSKSKRRKSNKSEYIDEQILETLKNLNDSDEASVEECSKVLDDMLDESDPLYFVAGTIFCESKTYREFWMHLRKKSDEAKKQWLIMVGKKMGLI
ncbi:uncharacterized protein LOC121995516 [Zingiber officinale]|uniref:uncharacterized protein LOC121995516 n=1 Tax=Zingiber officinale TaxID=94328 RepID=UPI001C4B0884|nr:uncharacterized protein LOC121995516 [Zingiber officinale]